jgi:hypothetical protein
MEKERSNGSSQGTGWHYVRQTTYFLSLISGLVTNVAVKKKVLNNTNLCLYSSSTILYKKRMRRSILCVVCLAVQYSSIIINRNNIESKIDVVIFFKILSETFPILIPTQHHINNVHRSSCTVLLFWSNVN